MYRMFFGKHKGELLRDVDTGYLLWTLGLGNLKSKTRSEIEAELDRRGRRGVASAPVHEPMDSKTSIEIVKAGYRNLSKKLHPDVSGSDSTEFRKLKLAYDKLMHSLEAA